MAGTEIGKAWVQIVPSADGISGAIQKIMDPEAKAAGESSGNKLMSGIKKIIAGAGIGAALKKTLDVGAELQQNLGGTEAVFGSYAAKIQSTAQSAYKNMGLSASDYMATANKMGSLFQGSGLTQQKSLELTTSAMQRAADVASVMGIDTSMAMESIAGAAKGNFTMMDNLGVAMNATTLAAYALEKGINFDWNTASNAEKAELAMQMFMERTQQYENNFARESEETLSGSIGAMKAAAQDLMGNLALGQNVGPAMNNIVDTAVTAFANIVPAIGNILSNLPGAISTGLDTLFPAVMEGLRKATDAIKANFPAMLESALQSLLNFSGSIRERAGQLADAGLTLIRSIADGIIKNIPVIIQTVPTIISNFAGIINDNAPKIIATGLSIIKNLGLGLIKAIPILIANIPQILKAIWDVFMAFQWLNLGKKLVEGIGKGIKGAGQWITKTVKEIPKKVESLFRSGFNAAKEGALKPFTSLKTGISNKLEAAKAVVKKVIDKIKSFFPLKLGKILSFSLPKISIGTKSKSIDGKTASAPDFGVTYTKYAKAMDTPYVFRKPTIFNVAGEAGDEVLYGRQSLLNDIKKASNGGNTFNVTLNANGVESPEAYAQRFARELNRQVRMGTI